MVPDFDTEYAKHVAIAQLFYPVKDKRTQLNHARRVIESEKSKILHCVNVLEEETKIYQKIEDNRIVLRMEKIAEWKKWRDGQNGYVWEWVQCLSDDVGTEDKKAMPSKQRDGEEIFSAPQEQSVGTAMALTNSATLLHEKDTEPTPSSSAHIFQVGKGQLHSEREEHASIAPELQLLERAIESSKGVTKFLESCRALSKLDSRVKLQKSKISTMEMQQNGAEEKIRDLTKKKQELEKGIAQEMEIWKEKWQQLGGGLGVTVGGKRNGGRVVRDGEPGDGAKDLDRVEDQKELMRDTTKEYAKERNVEDDRKDRMEESKKGPGKPFPTVNPDRLKAMQN